MKKLFKNFLAVILIFLILSSVFAFTTDVFQTKQKPKNIPLSQVAREVSEGKIQKITVLGNEINISYKSGQKAVSRKGTNVSLSQSLINFGVKKDTLANLQIEIKKSPTSLGDWLIPLLSLLLPLIIFIWFFSMIFKQGKGGAGQAFSFLKAPAKLFGSGKTPGEKVTFKDVADLEEVKEEMKEVVDFLKNSKKFLKMGARIPRGVLLIGSTGTGKTLIARAVANEAKVPFFSISGSEFVELFVGVGAARVRSLFELAKKSAPSIVFIDELDAIGKARSVGIGGGHEEREQTLNQILVEMDGFERDTNVIVIGATNAPEALDRALLRPGRFDRIIVFDLPDIKGREAILKIHSRDKPISPNVNFREIAERTSGFSGADLANLANEAAILAAKMKKSQIGQNEFLRSIEKVLLGPERKSHLLSEKGKIITAYHESGHALVATFMPNAEAVRKISIVSRGMAAGYTLSQPKTEKRIKTKSEFLAEIAVLLGGYCAEKLEFKEISTGAGNDLKKATDIARKLVQEYGMSRLGPIVFGEKEGFSYLKKTYERRNYSEKVAAQIDNEIERFIEEGQRKATEILTKKKKLLDKIAKILIKKESIEKEEFERLVGIKNENHKPNIKPSEGK